MLSLAAHTGTHIDSPAHFSIYHYEGGIDTIEKVRAGFTFQLDMASCFQD